MSGMAYECVHGRNLMTCEKCRPPKNPVTPIVYASSVSNEEIAKIKRELCGFLADDKERVIGVCGITVEQVSALLDEVLRSRLAASPAIPVEALRAVVDCTKATLLCLVTHDPHVKRFAEQVASAEAWLASVAPTKETTATPTAPPTATEEGD